MANEVIINIPGIGDVVAENAATEATLRDILAAIKSSGGTGGGAGGSSSANNEQREAQSKLKAFGNAISGVTSATVGLTGSIVKMTMSTGGLIKRFADLDGSVTSAAYEVRDLARQMPLIGEHLQGLGKAIVAVASAQDELVGSFQKASTVGATFAGSITQMAVQASAAGMTIRDYSQFIASNGEAMRALGGTTEAGTKRFAILSKALQDSSSGLYALGLSTADINAGLASYAKLTQYNANIRKKTDADLIASTRAYIKELDITAKMTGQSREQVSGEMAKTAIDAQFRSMIDSMGTRGADVEAEINNMIVQMGPLMGGYAKEIGAVGVPVSETNQQMAFALDKTTAALNNYFAAAKNPTVSKEQLAEMKGAVIGIAGKELGEYSRSALGGQVTAATPELMNLRNAATQLAAMRENARKQAEEEQKPVFQMQQSMQEVFNRFSNQITNVSNKFKDVLASSGVFDLLIHAFNGISKFIDKVTVPQFDNFGKIISGITKKATELGGPLFDKLMDMVDYLPDTIATIFKAIFGDSTSGLSTTMTTYLQSLFNSIEGFNKDISNMSPEQIRESFAIWATKTLEGGFYEIQTKWIDLQLEILSHVKSSWVPMIMNAGNYIELFSLYIQDFASYLKVGALGVQVGIDSIISKWNKVETWIDKVEIGFSHFADMLNYMKSLNPTNKYSSEDYDRDKKANDEYRSALTREIGENQKFEENDRAEHKKAFDDELASGKADREARKKHIESVIEENKKAESTWNTALTDYANKLNEKKTELETEKTAKAATVEERVRANLGQPMSAGNAYNIQAGALNSQAAAVNSMSGKGKISGSQTAYYNKMYNAIYTDAVNRGLPNPDIIAKLGAAQTSLESGYGTRLVGNNAFGIKGVGPAGSTSAMTTEYVGGKPVRMMQQFKKFNDVAESATGYLDFMLENKRYKGVLASTTIEEAIAKQGKTGYATSPTYAAELSKINAAMSTSTASLNTPSPKPVNSSSLNTFAAERQNKADAERQQQDKLEQEALREQERKEASQQSFAESLKTTSPLEDKMQSFDQLLEATKTSNELLSQLLSTHERHISIAQAQSGNVYAG